MKVLLTLLTASSLLLAVGVQAVRADFVIKVGYADSLRPNAFFPDPWEGSSNTIFWGRVAASGEYDAGAIQIINTGVNPLVLSSALVDHFTDGTTYHIWDGQIGAGFAVPVGQRLILTQNNGTENFDTSDNGPALPPGDSATPHVKLTLDGTFYDLVDTGQVLNTSGFDFANTGQNESFGWRPIGTFGGQRGDTPEPGTLAFLGAGSLVGTLFLRRRRKA